MKVYTEEESADIVEWCNWRIAQGNSGLASSASYYAAEIALAALTAAPDHYIFNHPAGKLFNSLVSEDCKENEGVAAGYTTPPVVALGLPDGIARYDMQAGDGFSVYEELSPNGEWVRCDDLVRMMEAAPPVLALRLPDEKCRYPVTAESEAWRVAYNLEAAGFNECLAEVKRLNATAPAEEKK